MHSGLSIYLMLSTLHNTFIFPVDKLYVDFILKLCRDYGASHEKNKASRTKPFDPARNDAEHPKDPSFEDELDLNPIPKIRSRMRSMADPIEQDHLGPIGSPRTQINF
jgi:hypothetical protein